MQMKQLAAIGEAKTADLNALIRHGECLQGREATWRWLKGNNAIEAIAGLGHLGDGFAGVGANV